MKAILLISMLLCVGCGAPDTSPSNPTYGVTHPDNTIPVDGEYNPPAEDTDSQHCGEWHWVTVWENGQPTAQLQPIICASGPNFNTGDPAPFEGDPDPTKINVFLEKKQTH